MTIISGILHNWQHNGETRPGPDPDPLGYVVQAKRDRIDIVFVDHRIITIEKDDDDVLAVRLYPSHKEEPSSFILTHSDVILKE